VLPVLLVLVLAFPSVWPLGLIWTGRLFLRGMCPSQSKRKLRTRRHKWYCVATGVGINRHNASPAGSCKQ